MYTKAIILLINILLSEVSNEHVELSLATADFAVLLDVINFDEKY